MKVMKLVVNSLNVHTFVEGNEKKIKNPKDLYEMMLINFLTNKINKNMDSYLKEFEETVKKVSDNAEKEVKADEKTNNV